MTQLTNIEWPSEEVRQRQYDDELISRYENGLPLTALDRKNAKRLIKARAAAGAA